MNAQDQRQEWINGIGKETIPSFIYWSQISSNTKSMYSINAAKVMGYTETNIARKRKDTSDKDNVREMLFNFGMFSDETKEKLTNLVTKHQATYEITESLVPAERNGQKELHKFVQERVLPQIT